MAKHYVVMANGDKVDVGVDGAQPEIFETASAAGEYLRNEGVTWLSDFSPEDLFHAVRTQNPGNKYWLAMEFDDDQSFEDWLKDDTGDAE